MFAALSAIMPFSAFALRGSTDCKGDVEKTAFGTWGGMTMESGFESFYSEAEKKVYKDSESLKKFQKKYLDALQNESLVSGWEYTKPLSCNSEYGCEYACNGNATCPYSKNDPDRNEKCKETNCKNGQKLKDCNYAIYKCMLNKQIGEEYQEYMIQKVCSAGTNSLSQSDQSAIDQEIKFQQSGMTSKSSASKAGAANQKKVVTQPNPDARAKANAEYAEKLREPWQEYEAHEAEQPINTDAYAVAPDAEVNPTVATQESSAPADTEEKKDKAPETKKTSAKNKAEKTVVKPNEKTKRESARADKTSEKKGLCTNAAEHHLLAKYVNGECIVESCVANYEVSEDKKSCVQTQKSQDRATNKSAKKDADAKDKAECENKIGGNYSMGACWCGATKVTDISKTCQQLDDEKQAKKDADKADRDAKKQERENQRAEEKAQKAEADAKEKAECENTIGGKYTIGACWCGTTKITDKSKTCEQIKNDKDTKKDQAKIEKEAKRITSKADSLSIGDSLTYETELENDLTVGEALSKWESQCEAKTLALDGGAEYSIETTNAGGQTTITCVITNCTDAEYTVATNNKSCTKNANGCADGDTKCNKAATKAETKLEKEFETDMNVLHTEFLSIIKSLINECKTKGGTIADSGECQVATQK